MAEPVLLRRGALGDVVLLGSVTAEGAVVVCDPRWMPVARRLRGVREVLPWGTRVAGAVDLQGGLIGRLAAPFARRIDKRSIRRRVRLWTGLGAPRPTVPELYAEAVGVRPVAPPWIDAGPLGDGLCLIPGAAWGPKRWSPEGFVRVGRAWAGPVHVVGGPGEGPLVERVAAGIPGASALVETGFDRTLEVLGRCRVAVSGDTGLMHLAGACGLAVVGIFGPTHPSDGFWVYPGEVVQREARCRPCTLHRVERCRVGDHRCLALDAGEVIRAVGRCAG